MSIMIFHVICKSQKLYFLGPDVLDTFAESPVLVVSGDLLYPAFAWTVWLSAGAKLP